MNRLDTFLRALATFALLSACSGPASSDDGGSTPPDGGSTTDSGTGTDAGPPDAGPGTYADAIRAAHWVQLPHGPTVSGGAKQDDVFWLDGQRGFLASGPRAQVYATTDGGQTWSSILTNASAYFRAVLFTDDQHGFVGNIGAGLDSSISDANVIYQTDDGGSTWTPVTSITGPAPQGICNFTSVDADHLFGVGRANGPAHLLASSDGGASWTSTDLAPWLMMAIDAHFSSPTEGLVVGMNLDGHCAAIRTEDGGATFDEVFTSTTPGSLGWKIQFPSDSVGYIAVQDTTGGPGTFGRTHDGGATWEELPLPATGAYPAIGVGFITEEIGWMAPEDPSLPVYRTFDGGDTWEEDPDLQGPINRFRFIDANTAYAVGAAVWKLEVGFGG